MNTLWIKMKQRQRKGVGILEKRLLEEMYHRYGVELMRYLIVLCGDRMLAEDILQETFCRALLSLPSGHANVRAWLYMVGRNLMLNEMKKRRRETPVEDTGDMAEALLNQRRSGVVPAAGKDLDPEQKAMEQERSERIREAMDSLDLRKREILELTYFKGLTLKEAAAVMGISHENARVLSSRARRELRRVMEVNGYEIP